MSIRIGIYDIFTHLIGGSFLLAFLLYVIQKQTPLPVDIFELSVAQLIILGIASYVLGFVATPLSSKLWFRFFSRGDLHQQAVEGLRNEIPGMEINLKEMDWYTLIAFIKKHNQDMAQDVEQFNAISIMLRSVSFSLLLFGIVFGYEYLAEKYPIDGLILALICFVLSIVLVQSSVTYRKYFYRSIYQSVVALIAHPKQLSVKLKKDD